MTPRMLAKLKSLQIYHGYRLRIGVDGWQVEVHADAGLVDTFPSLLAARRFVDSLRAV